MRSSGTFTGIAALLLLMTGCTRPVANVLLLKAQLENNKGDYKAAIADYNKAVELDPKFVGAYNGRGDAKLNMGNYDGAIADYTKAIELNPQLAFAYNSRGNAKNDKGDFDGVR